jgi:hypothetical protein
MLRVIMIGAVAISLLSIIFFTSREVIRTNRLPRHKARYLPPFLRSSLAYLAVTIVLAAVVNAFSRSPIPFIEAFAASSILTFPTWIITFFVVRFAGIGRKKDAPATSPEKTTQDNDEEFESDADDSYILLEDAEKTVVIWKMNTVFAMGARYGRMAEITSQKMTLSDFYKLGSKNHERAFSLDLYNSDDWRASAKSYKPESIKALRLVTERRYNNAPPFNTIVMDYGQKKIELNYRDKDGAFSPVLGNSSESQEGILHLHAVLTETMQKRFAQDSSERINMNVAFEGVSEEEAESIQKSAEDMVNSIIDEKTAAKKPPATHEDPF